MAQATDTKKKNHWLREAWHQVHRAKNRALLELLQGARPRLRENERPLWEELEALFTKLDECEYSIRELHSRWAVGKPVEWYRRLNELHAEQSLLTRSVEAKRAQALREIEGADTFLGVDVPSVDEVQEELYRLAHQCEGSARRPLLVEFFLLDIGDVLVFLAPLWDLGHLELKRISLPPGFAKQLAGDLLEVTGANVRNQTRAPQASFQESSDKRLEPLLDKMAVFVEPLASRLDQWQPTELIISPHSLLNLFPIHAARFRGGLLIERIPITYLPSPTLAGVLSQRKEHDVNSALMIGNPTGDLPGAQLEVRRVAEQFAAAGSRVQCFMGSRATSARLQTHAPDASVVHIACHSGINHDDFLRSGFHLSDRRMTVLEIMATLDLKRASLVYLSSCDSARPVIGRTEELMALARSFLYAGSPTVIASLWPLSDNAGRIFAENFYSAWLLDRLSLIRSFQSAMLRTKETEPDPLCWAPFIMVGAW
jgi:hypothetical protein